MINTTGLLWYDETHSKPLAQRIADAAASYRRRFGSVPAVAVVNVGEAGNAGEVGVKVVGRKDVGRWYVWVSQ